MAQFEYLDLAGLQTYDAKIKEVIATKVDKVEGKGLSTNDYDNAAVEKLQGIAAGAQVNVLEGVKVNGQALTATEKVVDVTVPTKVSDLTNDEGYLVATDIEGKVDKTITVNGQALSANVELDYEDVGAVPTTRTVNGKALSADITLVPSDIGAAEAVHVHDVATDAVNGFMSAADKAKLDGIEEGANAYVLPKATAADLGGVTVGSNITVADGAISLVKANVTNALGYVPMTSEEINSAIASAVAAAPHLKREIVEALPELSAAKEDIIYMLVEDATGGNNIYGEYMKVNGAWEKLGTTAADLTDYTKEADFGAISDEAINALFA